MRLFYAVPVEAGAAGEVVSPCRFRDSRVIRPVKPENIHFTLRFLGRTADGELPGLIDAGREVSRLLAPFRIEMRGGGVLPGEARPRVFFLGVGRGCSRLAEMARLLNRALGARGYPEPGRPFLAHLTVARFRGVPDGPLVRELQSRSEKFSRSIEVREFRLLDSELTPAGPIYRPVGVFPLEEGK